MNENAAVRKLVALALEEDLIGGDPCSELLFDPTTRYQGELVAREDLTVSGVSVLREVCQQVDSKIVLSGAVRDGERVGENHCIAVLEGVAASLFSAERVALNFLSHLSGVASAAADLRDAAPSNLTLLDTRKTTPGYRLLEKLACFHGGFVNHRSNLSELLMIKSNTLDLAGVSLEDMLARMRKRFGHYKLIEVEVRDFEECLAASRAGADIIMLDNMGDAQIEECLAALAKESRTTLVEVSGGVHASRYEQLANMGVRYVSTSAPSTKSFWKDISFRARALS